MKINVYDDNDNIVKVAEAKVIDLKFGTIRSLMELLNIDNVDYTGELLKMIYSAWDQIVVILDQCFPTMEYGDWDNVKLKELVPVMVEIMKFSFGEILKVPKDSKN